MSKDLTDVDDFTSPIHVPENADSRDDAAGDVELVAQRLANRTHHLNLHTAKFDAVQTWEQGQLVDIDQADAPFLRTLTHAGDHAGSPANVWKVQGEWLLTDGTYARFYSGAGGSSGNWALTTNAVWDPASGVQTWSKDDDGLESNALRCFNGELHFYGKAAGAGSWGTAGWDSNRGVMIVGDTLHANSKVHSFADVEADDDVRAGGDFEYVTPPTRTIAINPLDYVGSAGHDADGVGGPVLLAGETANYAVRAPHGAQLGQVKLKVEVSGSDVNFTTRTKRHYGIDYTAGTPGTYATVKALTGVTLPLASPGPIVNITLDDLSAAFGFGGLTVDKNEAYEITLRNNSGGGLYVLGVEFTIVDPGPRNF